MKLGIILGLCLILFLAGCATRQQEVKNETLITPPTEEVELPKENETVEQLPEIMENKTVENEPAIIPKNEVPAPPEKPVGCMDSDGQDMTTAGTVTLDGKTYVDTCTSPEHIKEYYCLNGTVRNVIRTCASGMGCSQGACGAAKGFCEDTDEGINITLYGEVKAYAGNEIGNLHVDLCLNTTHIREYYCNGTIAESLILPCETGSTCRNNACGDVIYCTDDDNGVRPETKGVATVVERRTYETYTSSFVDQCIDRTALKEYYCVGDNLASRRLTCDGYCDNGRCRE